MVHQPLEPVGGSLWLSFIAASMPIAVVLVLLGVVRRPWCSNILFRVSFRADRRWELGAFA